MQLPSRYVDVKRLDSGDFPRIRASNYFDAIYCMVTEALMEPYEALIGLDMFVANDDSRV